ncbi:MAG: VCBS repeat-containing protein [Planctomycetota bacterium]|nr:VCBS repeat-containing protein [Planctomycetota bacterium]
MCGDTGIHSRWALWRGLVLVLLPAAAFLLPGCNAGAILVGVLLALGDGDGGPGGLGVPTAGVFVAISQVRNNRSAPEEAIVSFTLASTTRGLSTVTFEVAVGGGTVRPASVGSLGSGVFAGPGMIAELESEEGGGRFHSVRWNALNDVGGSDALTPGVTLRLTTVSDDTDQVTIFVGNDPPKIDSVSLENSGDAPGEIPPGEVRVTVYLSDSSGDLTSVFVDYTTSLGDPAGAMFSQALTSGDRGNLPTSETGERHVFFWLAGDDLGRVDRDVEVRLIPRDTVEGAPGKTGDALIVPHFLDANTPPRAELARDEFLADPDVRRGQSFEFTLFDPDEDPVDVIVQWAHQGRAFPDLPLDLLDDPDARRAFLADTAMRRLHQVATLEPEIIEGRVEEGGAGRDASQVLATWIKNDDELRGLRGLAFVRSPGVRPGSMIGRDVELEKATSTQRRRLCSYDVDGGVLQVNSPFDPPADPGDLLRIDLAGSLLLDSGADGVVHRRAWNSAVDAPGGGVLRLRVTPFDRARDFGGVPAELCLEEGRFPTENVTRFGDIGQADLTLGKELRGPFGLRPPLVGILAPTAIPAAVITSDVDGDGRLDVVLVERGTRAIVMFLQTTPGFFEVRRFLDASVGEPRDLVATDLDGDGDVDIALVTDALPLASPGVALFFQEGNLDFIANRQFIPGGTLLAQPSSLVAADLDGDGDVDLAISDADAGKTALTIFYRGNPPAGLGSCGATRSGYTPCSVGPPQVARDLALADVDGDSRVDLVTGHSDGFSVFYGDGNGVFDQRVAQAAPGISLRSVAVGDIDGDGTLDLVGGDPDGGQVIVARQITPEAFELVSPAPLDPLLFRTPVEIRTADLDGNGRTDVVVADTGRPFDADGAGLIVCLADSEGAFSSDVVRPLDPQAAAAAIPRAVALADLDADGLIDLISVDDGSRELVIYLQDRAGNFSASADVIAAATPDVLGRPQAFAAGDVDGDGRLDVSVLSVSDPRVTVVLPRDDDVDLVGHGFSGANVLLGAVRLAVGDIDGDGRLDLATADFDSDSVSVLLQDAFGVFTGIQSLRSEGLRGPESVALADLDGDGRLDVVTAGRISGDVVWFAQRPTGDFSAAVPVGDLAPGVQLMSPLALVAADVDADGLVDVVVPGHQSENLVIFYQSPKGGFEPGMAVSLAAGTAPVEVVVEDLDRDGRPDLVVAALGTEPLTILRQSGLRVFSASPRPVGVDGVTATAVAVADLNGDGRLDLALADADQVDPAILVFLATEDGRLGVQSPRVLRSDALAAPVDLLTFDFDGDGEVDIMSANRASSNVTVFRGGR